MKPYLDVKPVTTLEELQSVRVAATQDGHQAFCPTHYAVKDGEIVGVFNTGPIVMWWLHSTKCRSRDSAQMLSVLEALQRQQGFIRYAMLCTEDSPYTKLIAAAGQFEEGWSTKVFTKELV